MNELNKRIEYFRKLNGYTQKELATYLNISPQSVSKWEKGEATPNLEFIVKMSNLFMVSLDEFVIGKNNSINKRLKAIFKINAKNENCEVELNELIEELFLKYRNTAEPMWVNGAKNILKGTIYSLLEQNTPIEKFNLETIKSTLLITYVKDDKMEKLKEYFNNTSIKVKELVSHFLISPKLTAQGFLLVIYNVLQNI